MGVGDEGAGKVTLIFTLTVRLAASAQVGAAALRPQSLFDKTNPFAAKQCRLLRWNLCTRVEAGLSSFEEEGLLTVPLCMAPYLILTHGSSSIGVPDALA
jgi:hypothetical protein